jgi:hypothetical protein
VALSFKRFKTQYITGSLMSRLTLKDFLQSGMNWNLPLIGEELSVNFIKG